MQNTENKFKYDGLRYESADIIDDVITCTGCAGYYSRKICLSAPVCYASDRQDRRNIIFVHSGVDNLGDEE